MPSKQLICLFSCLTRENWEPCLRCILEIFLCMNWFWHPLVCRLVLVWSACKLSTQVNLLKDCSSILWGKAAFLRNISTPKALFLFRINVLVQSPWIFQISATVSNSLILFLYSIRSKKEYLFRTWRTHPLRWKRHWWKKLFWSALLTAIYRYVPRECKLAF